MRKVPCSKYWEVIGVVGKMICCGVEEIEIFFKEGIIKIWKIKRLENKITKH